MSSRYSFWPVTKQKKKKSSPNEKHHPLNTVLFYSKYLWMIHSGNLSNVLLRCHMHKIYPKGCTLFSKQKALFLTSRPQWEMETGETITVTVIVRSKSSHSAAHRPLSHAGLKKVNTVRHFTLHTWRLDGCDFLKRYTGSVEMKHFHLKRSILWAVNWQPLSLLGYCCCTSRTFNSPIAPNAVYNDKYGRLGPTTWNYQ